MKLIDVKFNNRKNIKGKTFLFVIKNGAQSRNRTSDT